MAVKSERKHKAGAIREQNMQVIIDAAEYEFAVHGYRGTTMQMVADRAGIPKANLHYYIDNKEKLYTTVLERITDLWNTGLSDISVDDDPAVVLESLIRQKVVFSYERPLASKLFATEIIAGAPYLKKYIRTNMRPFIGQITEVLDKWIKKRKMKAIDPYHLIFMIWATTQHYADFETQVLLLMSRTKYKKDDIENITRSLTTIILGGCGLTPSWE